MNAKKIMGAVLVALLAAALFVGAGAAAIDVNVNGETVFVNQKLDVSKYGGNWIGSNGAVTPLPADDASYVYFPAGTEGVYTAKVNNNEITLTVKSPEILVSGIAGKDVSAYKFINGIYYVGTPNVDVEILSAASESTAFDVYLTQPDGSEIFIGDVDGNEDNAEGFIQGYLYTNENTEPTVGEYSISARFPAGFFVNGTLYTDMISKPVTFKVAEADATTITASVDQALPSDSFKVTITGQPGKDFTVSYDKDVFTVAENQLGLPNVKSGATVKNAYNAGFVFEMPNTGKVEFVAKLGTAADKTAKMEVQKSGATKKQSVSIAVLKGTVSAKTDAASYFVGDVVKITGTSTAGAVNMSTLKLTGTNFVATKFSKPIADEYDEDGTAWSFEINTALIKNEKPESKGKMIDVGTYTLSFETESGAKATVSIVLKQPFITIISAPEVVVQGEEAEFIVNAEATKNIRYYIFGTNYFNASADVDDLVDEDIKNEFTFTLGKEQTKAMDAGQYFVVIQHPMYDEFFNIQAKNSVIQLIDEEGATPVDLFTVNLRQTANAAQALCDALDTQNIDDMYVKYSFFVVGKDASFTISEIPTTIAQGETLTISGVSTAAAGEYVTVEMISTAFAAVPKETVGSAAFIAVTTQVAEDGTWEITFDTSDLNVDEYSLKVAVTADGETETWKNVNINVVEAADKPDTPDTPDVPDTPDTPDTPTEPETPGFGALAALAGLGAVAVLLLRRE